MEYVPRDGSRHSGDMASDATQDQSSRTVCPQCGTPYGQGTGHCPLCGSAEPPLPEAVEHPVLEGSRPAGLRPSFRFEAVGATLVHVAWRPEKTFRSFDWAGGFRCPVLYSLLVAGPCVAMGCVIEASLSPGGVAERLSAWRLLGLVCVAPPLYLSIRAHVLHLLLVLQGAADRPFEATFRAVAYSNVSVAPVWLVPPLIIGSFLFLLWGSVVEITALREAHRLSLGKALLAVVLPIPCVLTLAFLARLTLEFLVSR